MNAITLPAELEAWAQAEVDAGHAASVDQLVVDALTRRREALDYVRARLDEGRAAIAEGRVIDGDVFMAELSSWIEEDSRAAEAS